MAQAISILAFVLLALALFLSIGLVCWEVWSMRRRGRKFRFRLRVLFLTTTWVALTCGLAAHYGWTSDVLVIGSAAIAGIFVTMQLIYFVIADVFPGNAIASGDEQPPAEIKPPRESGDNNERHPRGKWVTMPRRKWGRYGLWK